MLGNFKYPHKFIDGRAPRLGLLEPVFHQAMHPCFLGGQADPGEQPGAWRKQY